MNVEILSVIYAEEDQRDPTHASIFISWKLKERNKKDKNKIH